MSDEGSVLTKEIVHREAGEILCAIVTSQAQGARPEHHWNELWQLVRESKAAGLLAGSPTGGPWHLDRRGAGLSLSLTAGRFVLPIWPQDGIRMGAELPFMLNWAGVPVPNA